MIVWAALSYAMLGALGAFGLLALGRSPAAVLVGAAGDGSVAVTRVASVGLGLLAGAAIVVSTRAMASRWRWARALSDDLSAATRTLPPSALVMMALGSGIAEEVFFRGFLVSLTGVVPAAAVFGLAHQMRGRSRWTWVMCATAMGALLGLLFVATKSLVGPIVAHVFVNCANLAWLRARGGEDRSAARRLGGLLDGAGRP
jgi:membrane protease YdiL (CAAX protease family)